jgi:ABC-type nitrate/sulfonate/bicarbonate transport system permease component
MSGVLRRVALVLGLPAVLVVAWWFVSAGSTNMYFPPLRTILRVFGQVWFSDRMLHDVLPSVLRLLGGYALAAVLGVTIGVVIGESRVVRGIAEPVLEFFRAIPPPVLVPVLILFTGFGDTMKVLVIASGCVWPVLLNTTAGVRAADEVLADTARCYRIGGVARLRHLVLPGASPQIMTGLRQALSIGIILMVISELYAANNGLGYAIVQFQRSFDIPQMWSGILLLGLLGVALAAVFGLVERRVLGWYHGQRRAARDGS